MEKVRSLKVKSEEENKDCNLETPHFVNCKGQILGLPLKFYPQYSTNIHSGIERVARHFYILETLE